jgi:hypothetical protein
MSSEKVSFTSSSYKIFSSIVMTITYLIFLYGCRPVVPASEGGRDFNRPFIAFNDASPCQDYGELIPVEKPGILIFDLPFFLRINEEGEIRKESYPATENQIYEYIHSVLKKRYKFFIPEREDPHLKVFTEAMSLFVQRVLNNAAEGKGSPLTWGQKIPNGILDKHIYVYFPLGIERESKHHINARFYVLVANSEGEVIFARCIPYNPNKWSADIEVFKQDIKGKLPLVE